MPETTPTANPTRTSSIAMHPLSSKTRGRSIGEMITQKIVACKKNYLRLILSGIFLFDRFKKVF